MNSTKEILAEMQKQNTGWSPNQIVFNPSDGSLKILKRSEIVKDEDKAMSLDWVYENY